MNQVAEFDFGVTALAQLFHQDWPSGGTPSEVADAYIRQLPYAHLAVLADDLSFMAGFGEKDVYAGVLWFASTVGYYRPELAGMPYEDFFRHVLHRCNERLRQVQESSAAASMSRHQGRSGAVRSEIRHLHYGLEKCLKRSRLWIAEEGSPSVIDALYRYAGEEARPELAFRFLLRLIVASSCTISSIEYAHLREVGASLGYGEFLVSAVEFLVE
jgi:hypothetical protein